MPLLLDLCRLNLTVAHGVQVFIHRLFRVVEIMGGGVGGFRGRRLSDFGQIILFTVGFFCLFVLFRSSVLERESASREFFKCIFFFSITDCILAIQLQYYSTRDITLTRVISRGMKKIMYNTLLIIHFTNNNNLEAFQRSFNVKIDNV